MTRIFTRDDVRRLLTIDDCIEAVESVFRRFGEGSIAAPGSLGIHVEHGGFHVKAAVVERTFAAKINANFPRNPSIHGLPTIQGVIIVSDADRGTPLAIMDSMEITTLRTAAATAVAARFLAKRDAAVVAICGCGVQGRAQLTALSRVRSVRRAFACDVDAASAGRFAAEMEAALGIEVEVAELSAAVSASDIAVTCTSSKTPFIGREHLHAGLFVAAVGSDNPEKSEIRPEAMAASRVVVDILDQAAAMGDLHHAIDSGLMRREDVYADLGQIVAGKRPARTSDDEIFLFDSTGTALQDVVAAEVVYRRGLEREVGLEVAL
ncbi:MAG: ornithine cyclodeaminase family protein [Thermoanaerobaculia bacterium]